MTLNKFLANGSKREIILNTLKSFALMVSYDFFIKPLISYLISYLHIPNVFSLLPPDSLLIGFIAFLFMHFRPGRNIDLILAQADRKIIEKSIKTRDQTEDERGKTRHGSEQWNELSKKIAFFDRHIGHYERRILARAKSRHTERGADIPLFGFSMSPTQIKWVLGSLMIFSLIVSIGAYSLISIQNDNIETLTSQVSEEGIANIRIEIDELNTSYMDLKIQYEQLKEEYETLEEKNRELAREVVEAELKFITVTGIINVIKGRDLLGEVIRTPLEVKFESPQGELKGLDNDLDNGRYSVTIDNNCIYIVKIKYSSNLFSNWITVDSNFRLDSDVSVFSKNW